MHIQNVIDPFAKQLKNALNVQKDTTPPGHNLITSTTSNNDNALILPECNFIILDIKHGSFLSHFFSSFVLRVSARQEWVHSGGRVPPTLHYSFIFTRAKARRQKYQNTPSSTVLNSICVSFNNWR